jgi:hypothetical protein
VIRRFVGVRRRVVEPIQHSPPWASSLTLPYDVGIPLLDLLFADPTRYVTRSVANHVNDISKKDPHRTRHPRTVARLRAPPAARDGPCDRPCRRTLVRADHPRTLDLVNSSIVDGQQAHEDAALNT